MQCDKRRQTKMQWTQIVKWLSNRITICAETHLHKYFGALKKANGTYGYIRINCIEWLLRACFAIGIVWLLLNKKKPFHRCNQMKSIWGYFCWLLHKLTIFNGFLLRPIEIKIKILRFVHLTTPNRFGIHRLISITNQIKTLHLTKITRFYDVDYYLASHRNEINAQMPISIVP